MLKIRGISIVGNFLTVVNRFSDCLTFELSGGLRSGLSAGAIS